MTSTAAGSISARPLTLAADWERPVVADTGDRTALLIRITTGPAPGAARQRAPVDIAFALDRSGSMSRSLPLAKDALLLAVDHLDARDRIAVVAFNDRLETVQPLAFATPEVRAGVRASLAEIAAGGTTYLSGGWLAACQQLADAQGPSDKPHCDGERASAAGRIQRSVLLTDGLANWGITGESELAHHAGQLRRRGISTSAVGLGAGFDEFLLSGMAEAGGGAFAFAAQASELAGFFAAEIGDLLDAVALTPTLELTWPEGLKARLVNAFPVDRVGRTITVDLRTLRSDEELKILFTVTSAPRVDGPLVANARVTWIDPVTSEPVTEAIGTEPLLCVDPTEAAGFPKDPAVAEALALEEAAKAHREAIRLDREGRYEESRRGFERAAMTLRAAPQSADVLEQARLSAELSSAPIAPLAEDIRKERVAHHSRHSRGVRPPR